MSQPRIRITTPPPDISSLIPTYTSTVKHLVKAGVPLTKGHAVYITGSTGNSGTNMIAGLASNASEMTSSKTMGLIESTVSTNGQAYVVTEGLLSGLDTSSAVAGDPVWLGTEGHLIFGLTNKPKAPAHLVFIGIVTRAQQNNGEIFAKPQNGFELEELHNLVLTNVGDGNAIVWDSASSKWINKDLSQTYVTLNNLGNSLGDYVPVGDVGQPDGVASLDSTGNVPVSQLNNIPIPSGASWNYIGSVSSSSGSNVSFNNLNGQYKELRLTFSDVSISGGSRPVVYFRFNNDSSSSNYSGYTNQDLGSQVYYGNVIGLIWGCISTMISFESSSGTLSVANTSSTESKGLSLVYKGVYSDWITSSRIVGYESLGGSYNGSAISSINISLASGSFSSGTWKLWGLK